MQYLDYRDHRHRLGEEESAEIDRREAEKKELITSILDKAAQQQQQQQQQQKTLSTFEPPGLGKTSRVAPLNEEPQRLR